jgi:hypothetical protein
LVQSIARESGRLCPKMTSSDGSFSSPPDSSSRCWLAWLLAEGVRVLVGAGHPFPSSIDMYNNDVGKRFMK